MNPDHRFVTELETQLKGDLPGMEAQVRMAPKPREEHPELLPDREPTHSAVLICLFPNNGSWSFFLTKRSHRVEHHRGQISLPGGAWEDGESLQQTALRETQEELGLNVRGISVIGKLTPLFTYANRFEVHPFVGWVDQRPEIEPNPLEVAETYEISIEELLAKKNLRMYRRTIHNVQVDVPLFDFIGVEVWGATAMILSEFREIVLRITNVDVIRLS